MASEQDEGLSLFRDRFGLDDHGLSSALDVALERPVDHADLFFEYTTRDSVALEEGIVKSRAWACACRPASARATRTPTT